MKKIFRGLFLLIIVCTVLCIIGCKSSTSSNDYTLNGEVVNNVEKVEDAFKSSDTKTVDESSANATIVLDSNTATISDTTRGVSGSELQITSKGTYLVTGSSSGVCIVINDTAKSGNIYLILDSVTMENSSNACIFVKSADKVIIYLIGNNSLTTTFTDSVSYYGNSVDGTIFSKDDLTINGEPNATLLIESKIHGIVSKDDLKLTGGNITISSLEKGIDANDSVRIGGSTIDISSGHDGISLENDEGDSYFYMETGSLNIIAGYDGIDVNGDSSLVKLYGGTISITAPTKGSGASKSSSISQKGIKCSGDIQVGDVELTIYSADDAIHSNASVSITDGVLELSSSDDGIHADSTLSISGGKVNIKKSYEGLESYAIIISGGDISVVASDDGVNAAGDTGDSDTRVNPWSMSSSTGTLKISGGNIYINASGDGLDSNGSLYISGGYIIVEGPTNGGNGALDKGDGSGCVAEITGGVVLALGTTDMAVNFDSGSQCSALVSISGSSGTVITVNDGSGFTFTTSKSFACAVYSSPSMKKGSSYELTAGSSTATLNFTSSYYYSNVSSRGASGGGFRR